MIIHLCFYSSNSVQEICRSLQLCKRDEALSNSLNEYHLLVQNPSYTLAEIMKTPDTRPSSTTLVLEDLRMESRYGRISEQYPRPVPELRETLFTKLVTDQVERSRALDAPYL